jgi:hypothetical protein
LDRMDREDILEDESADEEEMFDDGKPVIEKI